MNIRRLAILQRRWNSSVPRSALPNTNYQFFQPQDVDHIPVLVYKDQVKYKDLGATDRGFNKFLVSLKDYFLGDEHHTHLVFTGGLNQKIKRVKRVEQRSFEDLKFIRIQSGKGGNGSVSFFRDAHRPVGPPDGGDGGDGGDVYLRVVDGLSSLHKIKRSYQAGDGGVGTGSQLDGKHGKDIIIDVPVGTTIKWIPDPLIIRDMIKKNASLEDIKFELLGNYQHRDIYHQFFRDSYSPGEGWIFKERDEEYQRARNYFNDLNEKVCQYDEEIINEELINDQFPFLGLDLNKVTTQPLLLQRGGRGGMGNMHFLTKDIRNPRFSKRGRDGLTNFYLLELKLIADLGLVGLPNAGKSTLLRAISKAKPRVGHWEFTTLQPTIGTIDNGIDKEPFTVADIPGIIKGANENKGMGLDFLRHIERSGGLVMVISLESEDILQDLDTLVTEVGEKRMRGKKKLIIATKADLTKTSDNFTKLKTYVSNNHDWKLIPVCAIRGENIDRCIQLMSEIAA